MWLLENLIIVVSTFAWRILPQLSVLSLSRFLREGFLVGSPYPQVHLASHLI